MLMGWPTVGGMVAAVGIALSQGMARGFFLALFIVFAVLDLVRLRSSDRPATAGPGHQQKAKTEVGRSLEAGAKLFTVYRAPAGDTEAEYILKMEPGLSQMQAYAILLRVVAEGADELNNMLSELKAAIEAERSLVNADREE